MAIEIKQPDISDTPDFSIEDVLTMQIHNKWLGMERDLFATKWWDYKFMSPCEATFAYIDAFGQEGRKVYAREIDYERAQHITVVTSERIKAKLLEGDKKAKMAFAGYWRGRQVADAIGMPYQTYLYEALGRRMRAWQRTHLPTPAQVYRDRDVEEVANRWEELKASRVYYADHHAYLAQNFVGAPAQVDYFNYLIARAGQSQRGVLMLAQMIREERLPLEFVQSNVEAGLFEQVLTSLRQD